MDFDQIARGGFETGDALGLGELSASDQGQVQSLVKQGEAMLAQIAAPFLSPADGKLRVTAPDGTVIVGPKIPITDMIYMSTAEGRPKLAALVAEILLAAGYGSASVPSAPASVPSVQSMSVGGFMGREWAGFPVLNWAAAAAAVAVVVLWPKRGRA